MSDPVTRLNAALEGRYEIERELGEGGMATVYLADDLRHERKVALKVLKPALAAVVGAERFLAEIKTTANLQHPHILPLHDSGEADGFLYYVMPYIEGESLRERLEREKQLPVDEAVRIATDVAEALNAAHEQGVIHRDIKPANILLSRGRPLVADFGIALAVSQAGGGRLTETGLSMGTPYYMSPEQASADREPTPASDVYSLGCVLYEMLVGEPPFTAHSAQAVLARILTEDAKAPSAARASIPANVDAAIRRSLQKLPADRFRSAQYFAAALADPSFRNGASAEGTVGGVWKLVSVVVTVIAVSLAGGMVALLANRPEADLTVFRSSLDLGDIAPAPGDIIISPDGSLLAVAGNSELGSGLYLRRSDETAFAMLPGTSGARGPAFSPDGAWIVYRDGSGQSLLKVSTGGGPPLTVLASGLATNPRWASWSTDGTILFNADDGLFRIADSGGEPQHLLNTVGSQVDGPTLLPGGRFVLVTQGAAEVAAFDLETGSFRQLLSEAIDPLYVEPDLLLYAHPEGGLFAVRFDPEELTISGQPIPLLDDLRVDGARAFFSTSTSGILVYVSGGAAPTQDYELVVVGLDGTVDPLPITPQEFAAVRWSPNGRSVAYHGGIPGHVYVYDLDGGTAPRQLTFEGTNRYPIWSPDGSALAFSSVRTDTDGWDLFTLDLTRDEPEQHVARLPGIQNPRDWREGGSMLIESGPNQSSTGVWIIEPTVGSEPTAYIDDADFDDITISPDGAWAAYQADLTGVEEVYVQSFPDLARQVRITEGGGQFPRWSPDGSLLYYWSRENLPTDTLYAVAVSYGSGFSATSRSIVHVGDYRPEDWDLHPAGERFVAARPSAVTEDEPRLELGRVQVVHNFFEELKRLVPN